ncbi:MAG: SDR family oxidoreductase [Clostridia bacterium]|nr:SDR family oxidoreductase [Clostridia bacterium]
MNVLVTGGAGFIGSHIVDKLINEGLDVVVIDNLSTGKLENLNENAKFYNLDITSNQLSTIFQQEKIDVVIHQAAQIDVQKSLQDPVYDSKVNINGTVNLLECCRKYNVSKIIYASSAAVYGKPEYLPIDEKHPIQPMSFYGISKFTPENYFRIYKELYGLNYTILRYSNIYGPRQDSKGEGGVIAIFIDKLLNEQTPIIFGDGEQTRDFLYVEDVAEANFRAIFKGDGEILNISTNTRISVNQLYTELTKILQLDFKPVYREARPGDILHSSLNNQKAIQILNWQPKYTFSEGLLKTVSYYKSIM